MQTFLPLPSFQQSIICLDNKRLGKQRVEAKQLITAIQQLNNNDIYVYNERYGKNHKRAWINHPCTKMWKNNIDALKYYYNCCLREWIGRGFKNTMPFYEDIDYSNIKMPSWFGDINFHNSHKSNLLRKKYDYYCKFGWNVVNDLPYIWPV